MWFDIADMQAELKQMLCVAVDFNVENDMPSFSSQAIFMVCNVLFCSVTLLTLQRESYVTGRVGKQAERAGPRPKTCGWTPTGPRPAFTPGLVHDSHPLKGGTHRTMGVSQAEYW